MIKYVGETATYTIEIPRGAAPPSVVDVYIDRDGVETLLEDYENYEWPSQEDDDDVIYDDLVIEWVITGNYAEKAKFVIKPVNEPDYDNYESPEFEIQRRITMTGIKVMPFTIEGAFQDASGKSVTVYRDSTGDGEVATIVSESATIIVPELTTPLGYGTHLIKITLSDGSDVTYKYFLQKAIGLTSIMMGTRIGSSIST